MSQDYFPGDGAADRRATRRPSSIRSATSGSAFNPEYMTVGSGSTSANAHALMASLERDSGYGTSIPDNDSAYRGSTKDFLSRTIDLPTPAHTPTKPGEHNAASDHERQVLTSHIHQKLFDRNRATLGRAITRTVDTLKDLQDMNSRWPAQYPSIPQHQDAAPSRPDPRPGIQHTQSSMGDFHPQGDNAPLRPGPRRAATSLDQDYGESSSAMVKRSEQEPVQLITPQAAHDFSILKLDLQLQGVPQSEIAQSLDKKAIASLLDGRITSSIRHLLLLQERIEDTSSKVLVTGDLNAGKSTFCNALLRRKVLPEDQQPCTSIFCEVLDARENSYIEEVHAIHKESVYNRSDESTYDVYTLQELEKIVVDNERYTQCKVYVKDARSVDESLLNNKIVDISIIDAPGLNSDSLKTTAVFARQEEIDVVVFVVSAANHFTLSAKEFILNAAHEKAYIFIVVNGFDNIRDKERCQRIVLEQVNKLSPRTFKESAELVHFVSSNAIPVAPTFPPSSSDGRGGGGGSSGGSGDNNTPSSPSNDFPTDFDSDSDRPVKHSPDKGKGKEKEKIQDFEELETSLRRFVLEKRARSKLAPAKTYLLNILRDLDSLATVNRDIAQAELDRVTRELQELEPQCERSRRMRVQTGDDVDRAIEASVSEVYSHTIDVLNTTISRVAEADLGVEYPGLWSAFQFAEDLKTAMLDQISSAVTLCEDDARRRATTGVLQVNSLGKLHLGEEYDELKFKGDMMFRRKRDVLARQVDARFEVWDFFDVSSLWTSGQEKVAGTGMAVTVVGVVGSRLIGGVGWLDGALGAARVIGAKNVGKMIVPGLVGAAVLAATYVLTRIPQTLPSLLSSRLATQLRSINYTHTNAQRISAEVSKVLRYPADQLRLGLQLSVEKLVQKRDDVKDVKNKSTEARKYFGNLCRESREATEGVERVDLEGNHVGLAGGF